MLRPGLLSFYKVTYKTLVHAFKSYDLKFSQYLRKGRKGQVL